MRKSDYAKLFTRRKDGVYQKYINGRYLYSKDPEELYRKWQAVLNHEDPTPTFKEVAEMWEEDSREEISVRTWLNYKPHYEDLLSLYGKRLIDSIDAKDVSNYLLKAKSQGYSTTVIKTKKTILKQIFSKAVIEGYLKYNPVTEVKTPKGTAKKRRAPTDEEIRAIFANINSPFGFFPAFLLCTGLRKSEALALLKSDIDLDRNQISVTKTLVYVDNANPSLKEPKTSSGVRIVPIVESIRPYLIMHMQMTKGNILFPAARSNKYMSEKSYDVAWEAYCKRTGLTLTAHQLRHGAATVMFESGVDVYSAQRILGHANVSTTMEIYTELRDAQLAKSVESLNKGFEKYL